MGHEEIWTRNAWVVPAGLAWPGGAVTDTVTTNWPPCATASGPRVRLVDRPGVREMVRLVEEGEAEAAVEVEVVEVEPRAGDVVVVGGRRGSWGELDAHGDHDPVLVHAPAIGNRHLSRELLGRGQDGGRRNGGREEGFWQLSPTVPADPTGGGDKPTAEISSWWTARSADDAANAGGAAAS